MDLNLCYALVLYENNGLEPEGLRCCCYFSKLRVNIIHALYYSKKT